MTKLAIHGGTPAVKGPLAPFFTIGEREIAAATDAMRRPLSGYLGGEMHGGYYVDKLERAYEETFKVKHAIAVNSATSGLLATCRALSLKEVTTTPYTMSATAAVPAFLGAQVIFADIEENYYGINPNAAPPSPHFKRDGAIIATNLFGHPAELLWLRRNCDNWGCTLIEDNAQAIFASERSYYTGTVGHVSIGSFNVHKQINAGEGGIVTTNNDYLAREIRGVMNHGELAGMRPGLNLRMTEVTAAIAFEQLKRAPWIVSDRIALAHQLNEMVLDLPGIIAPKERKGCKSSWYAWAPLIPHRREFFVSAMKAEGVPLKAGYNPLYNLPAFKRDAKSFPVTERVDSQIVLFEVCAHDPTKEQLAGFKDAFEKVTAWMVHDDR